MITVVHESDGWVAGEHKTGAFGQGDTVQEAISDLVATLRAFHADLVDNMNMLSTEMSERLAYLSVRFPKETT